MGIKARNKNSVHMHAPRKGSESGNLLDVTGSLCDGCAEMRPKKNSAWGLGQGLSQGHTPNAGLVFGGRSGSGG